MKFELNEKEIQLLEQHKASIIDLFGNVGKITFSFSNGSGIGQTVYITFEDHKITKDITDYTSW